MYCRNCGTKLPDGANFCPKCGTADKSSPTAETPAAKAVPKNSMDLQKGLLLLLAAVVVLLGILVVRLLPKDNKETDPELPVAAITEDSGLPAQEEAAPIQEQDDWVSETGDSYRGEMQDGLPHGQGTITYAEDDKYSRKSYTGELENGVPNGWGTMTYEYVDGEWVYEGQWQDGQEHGNGTLTRANGSQYAGDFENGDRSGKGTATYTDGSSYEGQWKNNIYHGQGIMKYANGDVYSGSWENQLRVGHGKMTYANGDVYIGNWVRNQRSGQGTITYANGESYTGPWDNNVPHGTGTRKVNGEVYTVSYDKGNMTSFVRIDNNSSTSSNSSSSASSNSSSGSSSSSGSKNNSSGTVLPDLGKFLGLRYNEDLDEEHRYHVSHKCSLNSNALKVEEDVIELLKNYSYLKLKDKQENDWRRSSASYSNVYFYTYTGSSSTIKTVIEDDESYDVRLSFFYHGQKGHLLISMSFSKGFSLADPEKKVSYSLEDYGQIPSSGSGSSSSSNETYVPDFAKLPCLTCDGYKNCKKCDGRGYLVRNGIKSGCNNCSSLPGKCPTCRGSGYR